MEAVGIERIEVGNLMALRHAVIEPAPGLTVLAASNAQGKTAVLEAISYALDPAFKPRGRTTIKSLDDLITLGAKAGYAELTTAAGTYRRELKGGKHSTTPPSRMDHLDLLISADLATMKPKDVRERILALLGGKTGAADIMARLVRRGCDKAKVAELEVLLKGGTFEPALKRVAETMTKLKGEWQGVTGEKWGSKKALGDGTGWKPKDAADLPSADQIRARIKELEKEERDLDLATRYAGEITGTCPCCNETLTLYKGAFYKLADLPKPENSDREGNQRALNDLRDRIANNRHRLELVESGADIAEKAWGIYQSFCDWQRISDALQPDGIPGELWASATRKLDALLVAAASETGIQVSLGADGEPRLGLIPYGLLSESQQWRVNAILRVSLARLSGLGIACIDRFDVLAPADRAAIMTWLLRQAEDVQIIVAGTFKERPRIPGATVCWLRDGTAEQDEVASAAA